MAFNDREASEINEEILSRQKYLDNVTDKYNKIVYENNKMRHYNFRNTAYIYKLYKILEVGSIEDIIYNFKIIKNKNQGLKSIFQNLNTEINSLKIEENDQIQILSEIISNIKIKHNEYENNNEVKDIVINSIAAQDIEVNMITLKESFRQSELQFNQKEENIKKIINFLSIYDFKLQNLMGIINIFEVMKNSQALPQSYSGSVGSFQNNLSQLIKSSNEVPKLNKDPNSSTNKILKIHLKIKKIQDWQDIDNVKTIAQFILNFQWKVDFLSYMLYIQYLQTNLEKSNASNTNMIGSLFQSTRSVPNSNNNLSHTNHSNTSNNINTVITNNYYPNPNYKNFQLYELLDPKLKIEYEKFLLKFNDDLNFNKSEIRKKEDFVKQRVRSSMEKLK